MLVACYLVNYALFRIFFDYGFMQGAPVYVAAQDPHGLFPAWNALVFYLSCLSAMFLMLNFDLWPLTTFPGVMRQPVLGAVWTVVAIVLGGLAFYVGVIAMGMDVVAFMVRVPVPFIFGSIVVLNMLQGSLFAKLPAAGQRHLERGRRRRDRAGAVEDVRRAGADGDGAGRAGSADLRFRDLAGVGAAQRDVSAADLLRRVLQVLAAAD